MNWTEVDSTLWKTKNYRIKKLEGWYYPVWEASHQAWLYFQGTSEVLKYKSLDQAKNICKEHAEKLFKELGKMIYGDEWEPTISLHFDADIEEIDGLKIVTALRPRESKNT
jgi:hypothetical protein